MKRWVFALSVVYGSACGVTSNPPECGNGTLEADEQCDGGAENGEAGSCCSEACELATAATTCRDAVNDCDLAEACDGLSGACPDDVQVPDDTPCTGNGVTLCSGADTCQAGACASNDLPADAACGNEITCNPDRCDGNGTCVDAVPIADGATCSDNGGNLCCSGACAQAGPSCNACSAPFTGALNVAIVESQSNSTSDNMDTKWKSVAESLGHTATIHPQTVLDSIANLADVDILIVASHDIVVPLARRNVIKAFANQGKGIFIQGEFNPTFFEGNLLWEDVVDTLGGAWTWGAQVGSQTASAAVGCVGDTPNDVILANMVFGATGGGGPGVGTIVVGTNVNGTQPTGFRFCASNGALLMTLTDKDNIRNTSGGIPELMKNIVIRLSHPEICP